jgi:DNA-binding NarL/FixJ family response regulator
MITKATAICIPRNCFKCGSDFLAQTRRQVCPACRKPKLQRCTVPSRELTLRERQIVSLIRFGKPNKTIAYELHLTEGTVKEYLNRVFRKLEVNNRTELAVWAYRNEVAA